MTGELPSESRFAATAPRPLRIGDAAPVFSARSTQGQVQLSDYRGRWLVLFSHPADFTPVCTSEFIALARLAPRFEAIDVALMGLSVDSLFSHLGWLRAIRGAFDVEVPFPVVEDTSLVISRAYGMLDETAQDSSTVRASYFIDPDGIVRAIQWYPMSVGRSAAEMLRLAAALRRVELGDAVTPEGWEPGDPVLRPLTDETLLSDEDPAWFCRTVERG
ncbi:redoxin domain-containing protein [Ancylobacter dichloromethanicus]|uniref:Thioredoxin peroxidase n=1 Tax=Ancylobacter dichloromethanicus TaxID=518825 RepID=A0A9W6N0L4_9HYPH|nr:redoxin domain-containing protein [Ancylobacter dichloromethanicus]MBS7552833.1 redoxin domain-containing protein [Ancylobacter dichloromethanicus]GLK73195.1 peroxiredoxin [Ancylobacter dichloromethanicus]